ncbi:unnamed protein product [Nyctereutes procyonoides]|uniref:(raccoon dog) hypothetical protein n=1 Tax=Nyctereutes procyonoides TaxID=34880 RepID=A0A811YU67_NYCPR|nr:unnamed protein product [Nyctereutes procyonoides]
MHFHPPSKGSCVPPIAFTYWTMCLTYLSSTALSPVPYTYESVMIFFLRSSGIPLSDHEALMATLCVRHSPPQHTPDPTQGPEAWTELDLGVAQAPWWATFAGYVIGLGLLLLALLCALAAGGGVREVAILLWTPSVGVLLGAGAVYLFHMQEAKGLSRARAELQHVLGRAREALKKRKALSIYLRKREREREREKVCMCGGRVRGRERISSRLPTEHGAQLGGLISEC